MTPHLSLPAIVSKSACAALLALAAASTAFAQGSDNAANYGTSGNWTNSSNRGTGFGAWNLFGTGTHGHFLGNSTEQGFGDVNTSGVAFAMNGNPSGNNYANAQRSFSGPLDQGQSFSIKLAIAYRNGNKGIDLYSAGGFGDNNKLWNFNVGGDNYTANGANLTTSGVNWAYSQTSVFILTANQVTSNTINISLTRGTDTYSATVNGTLGGIGLYVGSTDNGDALNNLYFNDLQITGTPTITGLGYTIGAAGAPLSYQITTTPAATSFSALSLPSGLSLNATTGLITGTPVTTGVTNATITASNEVGEGSPATLVFYIGSAADTASNYSGNWTDGSNGGTGFGNWTISASGGIGNAGAFIGNPNLAEINFLPADSFGLYANPADSGAVVNATRNLLVPLADGESFEFDWGINWDANTANGSKGFAILAGTEEVVNVITQGISSNITVNGVDTGFTYGRDAMVWSFTRNGSAIDVFATPRNSSDNPYFATISGNSSITGVRFYAYQLAEGDQRQPYFNNFLIFPASNPPDPTYDTWASSYGLNATVTSGPTAGAPAADPDSDSFTNQQEYAFGTNPTQATAGLLTTSSGVEGMTVVFLTRSDLTYNVQTTDNLSTTAFSNNGTVTGSVSTSSNQDDVPSGYIRKQFTIVPSGSRNFYRVNAN
jgi:Putative Ig domain